MFSIIESQADCFSCELINAPSCILETNCEDDLSKVDVIYIAENPGKTETLRGKPLVGRSGRLFRNFFRKFNLDKINYLITNVVLCQTLLPDGRTGNPSINTILNCRKNVFKIIETCNPKLIVIMGGSGAFAFDFPEKINQLVGKFKKWNGYDIFFIYHPSYILRKQKTMLPLYEENFKQIKTFLEKGKPIEIEQSQKEDGEQKNGMKTFDLPDKFYTDNYKLVDIQSLGDKILYIFRDKKNRKIFHQLPNIYPYYILRNDDGRKICAFDELELKEIEYSEFFPDKDNIFEGDIDPTVKHSIDYYSKNKGEANPGNKNIWYCDIEVASTMNGDRGNFPIPDKAEYPIVMATIKYNGRYITYLLDSNNKCDKNKIDAPEKWDLKTFKSEKNLLLAMINDLHSMNPDFLSGWNFKQFDILYIYNRLKNLGMDTNLLSPFRKVYINKKANIFNICGYVVVDQLELYKRFNQNKRESYKLGYIGNVELDKTKIEIEEGFNYVFYHDINKAIEYNIRDVELLEDIEKKVCHIDLFDELRAVCNTTFSYSSPFGFVDSTVISNLRKHGYTVRNALDVKQIRKNKGAFVLEPIPGIYDWLADLDFTSLYPSMIMQYNIGVETFELKLKNEKYGFNLIYNPDELPDELEIIRKPLINDNVEKIKKTDLLKEISEQKYSVTINGCFFTSYNKKLSYYSEILQSLIKKRKGYKSKMLDEKEKGNKDVSKFFDIRQKAYKILANALYGIISNKNFRFYNLSMSEAITLSGQEVTKSSIIYGNAFMDSLNKGKYVEPNPLDEDTFFSKEMDAEKYPYIVTGDTDSIFISFNDFPKEKQTVEYVLESCEKIQDFLNNNIMTNIIRKHNINPDEHNFVNLKNELIIRRGIFLAKKRYSTRVIFQEGKKIDEVVNRGIEIRRSDFPSESKRFLKDLLHIILYNDEISLKEIEEFIRTERKKFLNMVVSGDPRIARPATWNKPIDDYKQVPPAVLAMLAWNELVYDYHIPSSKGYLFKIKGIDKEKAGKDIAKKFISYSSSVKNLNMIALPYEEKRLPEYFIIDIDANMKFAFEDRKDYLLKPIFKAQEVERNPRKNSLDHIFGFDNISL